MRLIKKIKASQIEESTETVLSTIYPNEHMTIGHLEHLCRNPLFLLYRFNPDKVINGVRADSFDEAKHAITKKILLDFGFDVEKKAWEIRRDKEKWIMICGEAA